MYNGRVRRYNSNVTIINRPSLAGGRSNKNGATYTGRRRCSSRKCSNRNWSNGKYARRALSIYAIDFAALGIGLNVEAITYSGFG